MFMRHDLPTIVLCLAVCPLVLRTAESITVAQPPEGQYIDVVGTLEGPLGERVRELIDVINSGKRMLARGFVEDHLMPTYSPRKSMNEHLAWFAWAHDRSQGFDNYSIRHFPDAGLQAEAFMILRNHLTDGWEALSVKFESGVPYRITALEFFPARLPSQLPPPVELTDAETARQLGEHVKKLADADIFSGVVLLAKDGKPLLKKAFRSADRVSKVPNRVDTKFNIHSMSMMFTGVAIAQLVERGKLSLDHNVLKYVSLDSLPSAISGKATIGQLLANASEMGAKLIEKVSGKSYCEFVRDNIFNPARMSNTGCLGTAAAPTNLAIGYSRKWKDDAMRWTKTPSKKVLPGGPAGPIFSTVEDLLRFDVALRGHKLLKEKNTNLVLSPKPDEKGSKYDYGFAVRGKPGKRVAAQIGKGPSGTSEFAMYVDAGFTAIVVSNYEGGSKVVANKFLPLLDWPGE